MSRTFRLGLFIVSTLAILATGVFLIGERRFLFSSTYQIKTAFKNVAGLNPGAEVRVGGIHNGTVKRIELPTQPGGGMTVVMKLAKSTNAVIRKDSVASIQTEGLLGDKYVAISFGSPNGPAVKDGDTIASEPALDMADLMKKASDVLSNVQESSEHLSDISAKIDQGRGTMGALVNDRKVDDQLNQATAQAKEGAASFQENMEALKHNFFLKGFFNKRGYEDSTKLTEHAVAARPQGSPVKTFTYDAKKVFADVDTAKIKNEKTLEEAGRFLESNPFRLAVIVASGGMKGDTQEMHTLSQARAMVVRDYLVKNFKMDDTRVKTMGVAKSEGGPSDAGTVEIAVYGTDSRVSAANASRAAK